MNKETILTTVVQNAYDNLIGIAEVGAFVVGNYLDIIIPKDPLEQEHEDLDRIIDLLFWKFCDEIKHNLSKEKMIPIVYQSFCFNEPRQELIDDCFKVVNEALFHEENGHHTTFYSLLNSLSLNHKQEDLEQTLNTIFDILLDYYIAIKK